MLVKMYMILATIMNLILAYWSNANTTSFWVTYKGSKVRINTDVLKDVEKTNKTPLTN